MDVSGMYGAQASGETKSKGMIAWNVRLELTQGDGTSAGRGLRRGPPGF